MASDATFVFGIGAAKAGTTWLAQALRAHPQAVLPPFKETHYFDSLEQGTSLWAMDQMIAVRQGVRADISAAKTKKVKARLTARVREMDRWLGLVGSQIENDGRYQALMRRRAGADTVRLCADITPAYALLSEDCFRRMAAMNGGDTRFVMVLRDPIDRLWSNISMTAARRAKKGRDLGSVTDEMLAGISNASNRAEMQRSDYAATLTRLEAAVPEEKRLVLFFEDLFDASTLARLALFLGLSEPLIGPTEPANKGSSRPIDATAHQVLLEATKPQYDCVMSRFDAVPPRWTDNMKGPVQ